MKRKIKVVTVPKTANNLTTAVINFLIIEGHKAGRINTQGQAREEHGVDFFDNPTTKIKYTKSHSWLGFSDVMCFLRTRSNRFAIPLCVEIKKKGDRLRKSQKEFQKEVAEVGAFVYPQLDDIDKFKEYYYTTVKPLIDTL